MAKFDKCPNCGHKPSGHIFDGDWMKIYKCDKCGEYYCHECNGSNNGKRCPDCSSEKREVAGECWSK